MKKTQIKTRDIVLIKNDIARIKALIEKREQWLNEPINKQRSTWKLVLQDTKQLIETLEDLKHELNYHNKNF